jgi:CheY-like chemotaxis protein
VPGETVLVIDDSPTILKVVQLVLAKAGFQVSVAPDGEAGVEAAREKAPDLILLDFVMPKMNGYQVCRALQADDALKAIPVVLMSAKGDQVGERFVKVMGIVDYITKPFSPEAITAVVQHTIGKYRNPDPTGQVRLVPSDDGADLVGPDGKPFDSTKENRRRILGEARDVLVKTIGPRVGGLLALAEAAKRETRGEGDAKGGAADARVPTDGEAIAQITSDALEDEILEPLFEQIVAHFHFGGSPHTAALQGDLGVIPFAEVLQLLRAQPQSGTLTVTRGTRERARVDVFFRSGKVDFAAGHGMGEEFLIGRFVCDLGLVGKADLEAFVKSRPPGSKLLGQQLIKTGYISEADLRQVLTKQTTELVYEVLRWNYGHFAFRATRELPANAVDASLALDVDGILMEGFRRVDEWHLIEREIENFDLVFLRNEDAVSQMGRGRLTREELVVLELVNGKNSVKEIIKQSRMGSFDVSKMLYRLLSIKLIRRRVMPVAV